MLDSNIISILQEECNLNVKVECEIKLIENMSDGISIRMSHQLKQLQRGRSVYRKMNEKIKIKTFSIFEV